MSEMVGVDAYLKLSDFAPAGYICGFLQHGKVGPAIGQIINSKKYILRSVFSDLFVKIFVETFGNGFVRNRFEYTSE